jgi:hypothetical protein
MFVHAVYFWGQADLTEDDKQDWLKGLRTLPGIETVQQGFVGVPADTHRDVVENTYTVALILIFLDKNGHDRYQADLTHLAFVETCARYWRKVIVHDSITS